ncbi:hypothetical protein QUF57_12255 [Bacillus pumilus]|uniref:hypothetical protein n=1 Tax=Bacillus pumilus TaxID=1408 RepID=UPI0025A020E4|nr:hypothetical protein [Bacillus pumilus]MDM5320751.1 hypothetical protein [Bacillus pumilus]
MTPSVCYAKKVEENEYKVKCGTAPYASTQHQIEVNDMINTTQPFERNKLDIAFELTQFYLNLYETNHHMMS